MAYFKLEVSYFNSFWLKKTIYTGTPTTGAGVPYTYNNFATAQQWRGGIGSNFPSLPFTPPGVWPSFPSGCGSEPSLPSFTTSGYDEVENWFIEGSRYQEDFNAVSVDYGAKAYLKEDFN